MEETEISRKPVSKKVRFEVFKRDGFQCQYCGSVPPKVTLELDHIDPVANGGDNDIDNLITACFDCNRGKSDRLLSSIPKTVIEKTEILAEREEQLRAYQEIVKQKQLRLEEDTNLISEIFSTLSPEWELTDAAKVSVRRFIEVLGVMEVGDAMIVAGQRWGVNDERIFKYFCGVCWNKIRGLKGGIKV